jgi:NTP pyrophosphatase (non-canonical NTP hydrolase)
MNTEQAQKLVFEATEKRGYREGWNDVQFLARQITKLQEELSELSYLVRDDGFEEDETDLEYCIQRAGRQARSAFDGVWFGYAALRDQTEDTFANLRKEAADCQVVLFNIAAILELITFEPFDLVQAAVEKSKADIKRGVRENEKL